MSNIVSLENVFRPTDLRSGNPAPALSMAALADYLRAEATISVMGNGRADSIPLSGRAVRSAVAQRLKPLFPQVTPSALGLFEDDAPTPLRVTFDALLDTGDFIEASKGRFFPSVTRTVQLADGVFVILSGAPTEVLPLDRGTQTSVVRIGTGIADENWVQQSLESWLGIPTKNYVQFARWHMAHKLPLHREPADNWEILQTAGGRDAWLPAQECKSRLSVVIARTIADASKPTQRYVAQLVKAPTGYTCVAANPITFVETQRIRHGLKVEQGGAPALRVVKSGGVPKVILSKYALPELRRLCLALSFDLTEVDDTVAYSFAPPSIRLLETAIGYLGFTLQLPQS